jgi:hypothetical protein
VLSSTKTFDAKFVNAVPAWWTPTLTGAGG